MKISVDDKVEWFDDGYSIIKNYGIVLKVNKVTARVRDLTDNSTYLVKIKDLNFT
jgi:hypothetical protein